MSDQIIADSELSPVDDTWCPVWRPRRRKLVPLACITLILSLLLFLREFLNSPQDIEQLKFVQPPSFVPNASTTSITPSHNEEPVVFILIIWSEPSAAEGALLIKASHTASCAKFSLICRDISPYSCITLVRPRYTSYAMTRPTDIWRRGYLWLIVHPIMSAYSSTSPPGRACWIELNGKVPSKLTIQQACVRLLIHYIF